MERGPFSTTQFGRAWVALCVALAIHVADEALTDFLSFYNPLVTGLRERFGFFPMPTFTFDVWIGLLIFAVVGLTALAPFAFRGSAWMRPCAWLFGTIMLLNGLGHAGASVYYGRFVPGVYSSPLLLAAAPYLLWAASHR